MSVIVVGGGIDAHVAAQLLARRGRRVTLLEQPGPYDDAGWVAPQIIASLGVRDRGLRSEERDPWVRAPLEGGGTLELSRDVRRSAEAIARLSRRDAERWPRFCERVARVAAFLQQLYLSPPPDPLATGFALRARRLGREGLTDLMRFLPKSAAELLDDWFESDALKGLLGALAVTDLQQGARSGGTAFRLVHANVGNPPGVFISPLTNLRQVLGTL
jgi:phytoene dehydrogenase-like protein